MRPCGIVTSTNQRLSVDHTMRDCGGPTHRPLIAAVCEPRTGASAKSDRLTLEGQHETLRLRGLGKKPSRRELIHSTVAADRLAAGLSAAPDLSHVHVYSVTHNRDAAPAWVSKLFRI